MVHHLLLWGRDVSSCHTWHSAIHLGCIFTQVGRVTCVDGHAGGADSFHAGRHPSQPGAAGCSVVMSPSGWEISFRDRYCVVSWWTGVLGQQARLVGLDAGLSGPCAAGGILSARVCWSSCLVWVRLVCRSSRGHGQHCPAGNHVNQSWEWQVCLVQSHVRVCAYLLSRLVVTLRSSVTTRGCTTYTLDPTIVLQGYELLSCVLDLLTCRAHT